MRRLDNLDVVRTYYEAINSADLARLMTVCDDEIVFQNPDDAADPGTRVGKSGVREAASNLREAFDLLAHNYIPTTVHAGEADGIHSIRGALFDGRALRLGHGVRIAEDVITAREDDENTYVTLGPVAQWVKDREIALELSPSSNLQTGAIEQWGDELIDHPFDLLYQLGFRVTVNTDNRLMTATTLSRELALLADAFGYDLTDLAVFQLNAAASSFLSLEEREELADAITTGFEQA